MAKLFKFNGTALFLKEMLRRPLQIGAVAPSSKRLGRAMASWLPHDYTSYVLELGPGSGVVTEAILERGLPQNRLIAIEKSPILAEHLQHRFPKAHIICGDALELPKLIMQKVPGALPFSVVISGLPLCNFPAKDERQLTKILRDIMAPEGKFVQFSYRLDYKKARSMPNLRYVQSSVIWLNLPPARVSIYQP